MLTNFVRNIVSSNASNAFEKARIQATYSGDNEPPLDKDLESVLYSLSGKDPEIKGSAAFYIIIAKLKGGKSRMLWNYILKNLILMDKAVDSCYLIKEISELQLPEVENYKPNVEKYEQRKIGHLIQRYFRYIKAKGRLYCTKVLPLNIQLEDLKSKIQAIDHGKLLLETKRLKSVIIFAFDVFETGMKENLKYKLTQYTFHLILTTLIHILSVECVIFVEILRNLLEAPRDIVEDFYTSYKEFLQDLSDLAGFTKRFEFIPGFKFSQDQICNPKLAQNILLSVEDYLNSLRNERNQQPSQHNSPPSKKYVFHANNLERNVASFVETMFSQPRGDSVILEADFAATTRQNIKDEPVEEDYSGSFTDSLDVDSAAPDNPNKPMIMTSHPSKNPVLMFSHSFRVGFKSLIPIGMDEDLIAAWQQDDDAVKKEPIMNGHQYHHEIASPTSPVKEMLPEKHSAAFSKLLFLKANDDIFENYENFYSENYANKFEEQYESYTPLKPNRRTHRLKTNCYILTNQEEVVLYDSAIDFEDFDQDIFDNFENHYSKE